MKVTTSQYKHLLIADLGVKFTDGVVEVDDVALAERVRRRLLAIAPLATVTVGGEEPADSVSAGAEAPAETAVEDEVSGLDLPSGNASKAVWSEFLTGLGVDVPEGATRDDMKDIAARLLDE